MAVVIAANPMAGAAPSFPESFYCPITADLMQDPVNDPEGNSYERSAIEDWLSRSATSPVTRAPLAAHQLAPNRALKTLIEAALAAPQPSAPTPSALRAGMQPESPPRRQRRAASPPGDASPASPSELGARLVAAMAAHGLTEAEQRQLHGEGVVNVKEFEKLCDDDFDLSGIDIAARRQEKLERDRAAAEARHAQAIVDRDARVRRQREAAAAKHARELQDQVQGVLDRAGLTEQGREAVRHLGDLDALRWLDKQGMAEIGLNITDRRKLEELCNSDKVQQAQMPVLEEVAVLEELHMEEVMTAPEREVRRAEAQARKRREREQCSKTAKSVIFVALMAIGGVAQQIGVWSDSPFDDGYRPETALVVGGAALLLVAGPSSSASTTEWVSVGGGEIGTL
eukprot:COSAG04_NODE_498_length_13385_cov_46.317853_4_plen_399_part_00